MRFWSFRRRLRVPDFPLRCQHCTSPIRFSEVDAGGQTNYVDPARSIVCEPTTPDPIFHRPMPSVLG